MKIYWSPIALTRIDEIIRIISLDSNTIALKVLTSLLQSVERLKKFPRSGRIVPEIKGHKIREIIKSGFRIIYRIDKRSIVILTIRHSRRRISTKELVKAKDHIVPDDPLRGILMR